MTEAKLKKELKMSGKAAFIDHFDLFREIRRQAARHLGSDPQR